MVISNKTGTIFLGGPPLVKAAIGETATLMFDSTTGKWSVLAVNGATIS